MDFVKTPCEKICGLPRERFIRALAIRKGGLDCVCCNFLKSDKKWNGNI